MEKLSKYLPISEISEDFWITSYDTITFGYKLEMPEVYSFGILEADDFYSQFCNALKKLGNNAIVQKYGLYHKSKWESKYKGDSVTRKWNDRKFDARPVMNVDHFIFVSFYFGTQNLASAKSSYGGKKLNRLIDRSFSNLKKEKIDEFRKDLAPFEFSMGLSEDDFGSGLCTSFKKMKEDELLNFLERYLSVELSDSSNYDYASYDFRDGFKVGSREVSVLSMRDMPSSFASFGKQNGFVSDGNKFGCGDAYTNDLKLSTSFLFPLGMGLPCEHILAETYILLNTEKVEAVLEKELRDLRFLTGLGRPDAIDKKEIIESFISDTPKLEMSCCKFGFSLIVPHEKGKKIEFTTSIIDIASTYGIKLYCENRDDLRTFMFNLPGSGHCLSQLKLGWLESYIRATTFESYKNGNRDGIQFVDLFGKPFLFDFWDEKNKYLEARNGMLFAPTGAGKSFLTNHLLDEGYNQGDYIYIIDVGASYIRTTELNDGLYYDSKTLSSFSFNPFLMCYTHNVAIPGTNEREIKFYPNKDFKGGDDPYFVEFISMLILSIWYRSDNSGSGPKSTFTNETKDLLKAGIKMFYVHVNESSDKKVNFDRFYNFICKEYRKHIEKDNVISFFNVDSFAIMCKGFTLMGDYGFLLNSETHVSIEKRWVCFDLIGLSKNKDISAPVMLMIMDLVQQKLATLNGERLRFFIDEAVDFLENPIFGNFLGELYRKIRKMGGQVFIITQSIRYLDSLDPLVASSMFSNSHIKILLDHSADKEAIPILQQKLSLTDAETALLYQMKVEKSRPYRIIFMKFGNMPGFLFRHEVSAETFAAYNTDAKKIVQIKKIQDRTGNIYSAISSFVENEGSPEEETDFEDSVSEESEEIN